MKKTAIAIALTLLAGTAVPAHAETVAYTADPIKVFTYSVSPQQTIATSPWDGLREDADPASVRISFQNLRFQPISNVRFVLRSGNDRRVIVDQGTFSQGATITHQFALDGGLDESANLEVDQVTFSDGAVWNRHPSAP